MRLSAPIPQSKRKATNWLPAQIPQWSVNLLQPQLPSSPQQQCRFWTPFTQFFTFLCFALFCFLWVFFFCHCFDIFGTISLSGRDKTFAVIRRWCNNYRVWVAGAERNCRSYLISLIHAQKQKLEEVDSHKLNFALFMEHIQTSMKNMQNRQVMCWKAGPAQTSTRTKFGFGAV